MVGIRNEEKRTTEARRDVDVEIEGQHAAGEKRLGDQHFPGINTCKKWRKSRE